MCSANNTLSDARTTLSTARQTAAHLPPKRHEAAVLAIEASESVRKAAMRIETEYGRDFSGTRRTLTAQEDALEQELSDKEGQRIFEGDVPSLSAVEGAIRETQKIINTLNEVCD